MNAMTARGLSLGLVVAVWATVSHLTKLPMQLWPVIVGLGCFVAAGGGISGVQKTIGGTVSGVVWAMLYVAVSGALGRQPILDAVVLGAAVFGMVFQARFPLLSYTAGAIAGAAVAMGVLGVRRMTFEGGMKVAIALAIGAGLGYAAEYVTAKIHTRSA
ncbi:MAG TPA: DUF1097 domain-containing protein [Gemmatimonadales bacterium]